MAKVLNFPVKKQLSQEYRDRLYQVGKAYLDILGDALQELSSDDPTTEELDEIRDLVIMAYAEEVMRALLDKEKEL